MGRVQAMMARAAVVVAATVPLAACGGGGDGGGSAPTPDGFHRTQTADFSLALPPQWQTDTQKADGANEFIEARAPGSDVNRAQLRIAADRNYQADINGAVQLAEGEIPVRRPGATRVVSKPIDVRGAADARRVEWTVPAGGGLDAARIVTVLALSSKRTLVNLSLGVSQSQVDATRIDDIVRSLEVK
jgi:hypothetical protein